MIQSPKPAQRFKHSPETAWRRVDGEVVVLDLKTSRYYSLNDSAAFVWEKLASGASAPEIAGALCGEFEVAAAAASRDAARIIETFKKEKLLVPAADKKR